MNNIQELLELDDITLIPAPLNCGWSNINRLDYLTRDLITRSLPDSLPIFTSPMESVVNEKNWRVWENSKINSVIPRTVDLKTRIDLSQYVFSCFSFSEIKQEFIDQDKRYINSRFKLCLDVGNGHDTLMLEVGNKLKKIYGDQVVLMGGNIGNPETYVEYSKAGFDFIRLGMSSGSLVQRDKFGFHYPMASLIMDTCKVREKAKGIGIRPIGIIADGGIRGGVDIIKSIALGADYVMIGREFAKILEAAGSVFNKKRSPDGFETKEEILRSADLSDSELRDLGLIRLYSGNTTLEVQATRGGYSNLNEIPTPKIVDTKSVWIKVDKRLDSWISDFKDNIKYSFMLSDSRNWLEFKQKVRYGKL